MRRTAIKAFSQGFLQPKGNGATPVDLKEEFIRMKQVIRQQKARENQERLTDLPYQAGYVLIGVIILLFFVKATYKVSQTKEATMTNRERESEDCLLKYQHRQCSIDSMDGECKRLFQCVRRRAQQEGFFSYCLQVIEQTFAIITRDILGPIMMGILAFLLKIGQVMAHRKKID